ncbi:AsmA-like C-terminal domain-containing protein [Devosia sp. YIM 151766]|uniref:AsmA-like C-terminal domain-containing protein n=1 Tax=Devosia sp. YIM 151766 TaxID=3017325 RepID=UPI00255CD207|nr:AsmA-like C-terminal domain-containing protein [Devosia sp. YIM 151766]WIY51448.1 AsmA-like C-terminal domain-containing protein [Devosia sp. YIM 151766]
MSEATISTDKTESPPAPPRRTPARRAAKIAVWLIGIPCALLLLLYAVLLVTPIRLPFTGPAIRSLVQSFLPATAELHMGDLALALERGIWPVLRFEPVEYRDRKSGARMAMEALEIGFSPSRALFGQPGTTVTIVAPHIQIVQDLYGPRPTSFEITHGADGSPATLRVLEGDDTYPAVDISTSGIAFQSGAPPMRSDNDWLIYNLEASEVAIADLVEQTAQGRFSRLMIRDGRVEMADPLYGLYRQFDNLSLDIGPVPLEARVEGRFSALIGGRNVVGSIERSVDDDGTKRLQADVTNLDFSAFLPFIDDRDSLAAMRGAGAISIDVAFSADEGKLTGGDFKLDLTGIDLRLADDYFPVASSILDVSWQPAQGRFVLSEGAVQIGQSKARVAGTFAMGLDPDFGPTIGIALKAREVSIHPNDMDAPETPLDSVEFSGWSAPLYGAVGVDRLVVRKGDGVVEAAGRLDLLQQGLGVSMTVAGQGVSADDSKRLWPYIMGEESRDWFVANVTAGRVKSGHMTFNFPVGSMSFGGEAKPIPKDSMQIAIVGEDVAVKPVPAMPPIVIAGDTRLRVDDETLSVAGGGGTIDTASGTIAVTNPALVMDNSVPGESIIEISGDLRSPIPALLDLAQEQQPEALTGLDLPVDLESLTGGIDLNLVATFALGDEETGRPLHVDYVANGTISDFASTEPIQERRIGNGQLAFSASQVGYQLGGTAEIDGLAAEISVAGTPESEPVFRLASTMAVADLAAFGFDAAQFLSGQVRFMAQPLADGALQMSVDLTEAGLNIRDLGIAKARGTPGTVSAIVRPDGEVTHLDDIALAFGAVRLNGRLDYHATDGLVSAVFDTFALSSGDSASVSLTPMEGGYAVRIRGRQLDLKPVLGRFFSLGEGSGGLQNTQFNAAIALDVELDRAVGYYATTAFNVDLDLVLRGTQLSRAALSAQFGEGNAISITTNPAPNGRSLVMAFNDAGTVLRLLGIYSQLAGGSGSLIMTTDRNRDQETGQLILRDFAIVDEANVIQVLGNHSDSRAAIAARNRLDFKAGQVDFIRRSDRVEVTDAVLAGDTVGGTLRGFIYTESRQYDLTGTYVPLFGLNNIFSQIPLFGPLLGGRGGEGLVGVTFAVRGPLNQPQFLVNPLSLLAPGFLRELFEFRSRELPPGQ